MNAQVVWQQLLKLEGRGLVRLSSEGQRRTKRFKHALVREGTYASILTSRRAELHSDVAEAIQELFPKRDPIMILTLAEHRLKAQDYIQMLAELLLNVSERHTSSARHGLGQRVSQ